MVNEITIRGFKESDAILLSENANNKKIWDNLRDYMPFPYTLEDAHDFIRQQNKKEVKDTFAICLDDVIIGVIGFNKQKDIYRHSAEIGYWIGEKYWGNGYTTLALELAIKNAFENNKIARLYTTVYQYNTASMKVLEKVGFVREGVGIKAVLKNGQYLDEVKFGLLNPTINNEV